MGGQALLLRATAAGVCRVFWVVIFQPLTRKKPPETLQELAGENRPNEELVCPEATAGLWSTITFSWVSDLMKKGYKCAPLLPC